MNIFNEKLLTLMAVRKNGLM